MELREYLSPTGAVNALAKRLCIPAALLSQWKNSDRQIPIDRCPGIERATEGAVTCESLRPDVHWVRVKDRRWPNPAGRPLVDHAHKAAA